MDESNPLESVPALFLSPLSNDEFFDDDKRKISHSDSIYLTRKKVKSKVEDDDDGDESPTD